MMEPMVLIGTPEERVEIPAEEGVTKIGGVPHWLCGEPTNFKPNKCQNCGHDMALFVSADCPVTPGYDRVLYLYVCPKCGSSARCFRQKIPSKEEPQEEIIAEPEPQPEKPAATQAINNLKPVSNDNLLAALSAFDDDLKPAPAAQQKKGKGKKQKPRKNYENGYYPAYYVDIFEEPECELDPDVKFEIASSADSMGAGADGQLEEDTAEVDPILVEYNARLDREPSQVLRYCRGGQPLLQDKMRINVPKCPRCGGERCFELEVIPTIISKLDPDNFDLDFGPILIYTCAKDCGEGTSEEHVIVCPP